MRAWGSLAAAEKNKAAILNKVSAAFDEIEKPRRARLQVG
jgi:hypothetical protein